MTFAATRGLRARFRQLAVLCCTLLVASGAIELHNLANHHRSIEVGQSFDPAASHPGIPHHLEHSAEVREPACATCALLAQARGVDPEPAAAPAPAPAPAFEAARSIAPTLSPASSSASPRGPPAA